MTSMNKKLTVLIVDDDIDIVELVDEEFRSSGYLTYTAQSGNEAIEVLKEKKVDVIISDYKMPDGNGMDLLKHINKMKHKPAFYFVSGHSDLTSEECESAGALKFFTKPFDLTELINQITTNCNPE